MRAANPSAVNMTRTVVMTDSTHISAGQHSELRTKAMDM